MAPKARLPVLWARLPELELRMALLGLGLPRRSRAQMQVQEMPPEHPKRQERDFLKRSATPRDPLMQLDLRLQSETDSHFQLAPGYQKRLERDYRMQLVLDFHLTQERDLQIVPARDYQTTLALGFHLMLARGFQTIQLVPPESRTRWEQHSVLQMLLERLALSASLSTEPQELVALV